MSENGSHSVDHDEMEFEGVRSRLESGFYPTLMGPGPELLLVLALAFSQPVLWLFPEALTFLIAAIVFFVTALVMALRARSRGNGIEATVVALAGFRSRDHNWFTRLVRAGRHWQEKAIVMVRTVY